MNPKYDWTLTIRPKRPRRVALSCLPSRTDLDTRDSRRLQAKWRWEGRVCELGLRRLVHDTRDDFLNTEFAIGGYEFLMVGLDGVVSKWRMYEQTTKTEWLWSERMAFSVRFVCNMTDDEVREMVVRFGR